MCVYICVCVRMYIYVVCVCVCVPLIQKASVYFMLDDVYLETVHTLQSVMFLFGTPVHVHVHNAVVEIKICGL